MSKIDMMLIGMFVLCIVLLQFAPGATWLPVLFGLATAATTVVRVGAYIYERQKRVRIEQQHS
jgi:hypothetical protein